jgi:hypothetical protein
MAPRSIATKIPSAFLTSCILNLQKAKSAHEKESLLRIRPMPNVDFLKFGAEKPRLKPAPRKPDIPIKHSPLLAKTF